VQQHAHAQEALPAGKRHQAEGPKQLKHTRSYCSGRFTIQEAAYIQAGVLHRSTSAPECAGHLSSSMSSCSSLQATYGPFAGAHGCSSSSPGSSGSFAQPGAGSCSDLYAANQLMSGMVQLQQEQQAAVQQQPGAALMYDPGTGFPAPAHAAAAAAAGGLMSSVSVPVRMLSFASSDEEGSLLSSLISSSDYLASEANAAAAAAGPFNSAGSSRHNSSKRRSSGSNLLSSCCSGSAELLSAAAAAAAVGHHPHQHQHMAIKRSPSMTYFRRGRFLVQTTMG
jgi:hypothetical protein